MSSTKDVTQQIKFADNSIWPVKNQDSEGDHQFSDKRAKAKSKKEAYTLRIQQQVSQIASGFSTSLARHKLKLQLSRSNEDKPLPESVI